MPLPRLSRALVLFGTLLIVGVYLLGVGPGNMGE